MKFKSLALLIGIFSLSSCGAFDDFTYSGIFDDQEAIGRDALFSDTTFEWESKNICYEPKNKKNKKN